MLDDPSTVEACRGEFPPLPPGEGRGEGSSPPLKSSLPPDLLDFARQLRHHQTDAEQSLWFMLRDRRMAGAKFRRQHPIAPYVLDFYCHDLKLAIELDGGQHHSDDGRAHDEKRTTSLAAQGIRVVRFWNNDMLQQPEAVLERIFHEVTDPPPHPNPSPRGRRAMIFEGDRNGTQS